MTDFTEQRLPIDIRLGMVGGPQFRTEIVETRSGNEQRFVLASVPRRQWQIEYVRTTTQFQALYSLFLAVAGAGIGFRARDPFDYQATVSGGLASGRLGSTAAGTGEPTYQLKVRYASDSLTRDETITKPVSGTSIVYRAASPVTAGASPGNIALSTTTGIVTFVADDTESITGHTPGATHAFTTAADMSMLAIGEKVYITGVTGTAATTLNGIAHTISNKSGAGPYTWTISTVTTGLTASSGTAAAYPQAGETLTWAGEFDRPVRFASDKLMMRPLKGVDIIEFSDLQIVELLP